MWWRGWMLLVKLHPKVWPNKSSKSSYSQQVSSRLVWKTLSAFPYILGLYDSLKHLGEGIKAKIKTWKNIYIFSILFWNSYPEQVSHLVSDFPPASPRCKLSRGIVSKRWEGRWGIKPFSLPEVWGRERRPRVGWENKPRASLHKEEEKSEREREKKNPNFDYTARVKHAKCVTSLREDKRFCPYQLLSAS